MVRQKKSITQSLQSASRTCMTENIKTGPYIKYQHSFFAACTEKARQRAKAEIQGTNNASHETRRSGGSGRVVVVLFVWSMVV